MINRTPAFLKMRMKIRSVLDEMPLQTNFKKIENLNRLSIESLKCGAKILESRILMRMCHEGIEQIFEKKNQEQQ